MLRLSGETTASGRSGACPGKATRLPEDWAGEQGPGGGGPSAIREDGGGVVLSPEHGRFHTSKALCVEGFIQKQC